MVSSFGSSCSTITETSEGKCVYEIAEHSHYVQGVAWDPLNEFIATQSSDRSMHIYNVSTKPGGVLEVHAVGKNTRMPHRHSHSHSRTPSAHGSGRPQLFRRASTASDMESALDISEDLHPSTSSHGRESGPLTPATSVSSTPAFMFPPPPIESSSRRSSFSSNAPASPSTFTNGGRYGRSPSPMPPLPAIRSSPSAATAALWASVKLYGDESYTNFFRRLTFSPDGGLLLTPAGQFEDPSVIPGPASSSKSSDDTTPVRGRRGHPSEFAGGATTGSNSNSTSSVYIYSRANFARPPIAQLPGHKKASVAVRFSPVLYELRPDVALPDKVEQTQDQERRKTHESKKDSPPIGVLEKGVDGSMDVDVVGPMKTTEIHPMSTAGPSTTPLLTPHRAPGHPSIATPTPRPAVTTSNIAASSPALSPMDLRPPTPAASKPSTPSHSHHHSQSFSSQNQPQGHSGGGTVAQNNSVFALPYRMLFAVVTMDTVTIYDTQQATPLCLLTKLHYDEFTDMSW